MPGSQQKAVFCTCAVLLLGMLVRGIDGTLWLCITSIDYRGALATDFPRFVELVLADHAIETELEEKHTWASHIESRHTAQSGSHPLEQLRDPDVQEAFLDVLSQWTRIVTDVISQGHITSDQIIEMSSILQGRVALNAYAHANKYTLQNAAKCLANVLPTLLDVKAAKYDEQLHQFISQRQSGDEFHEVANKLHIHTAQALVDLSKKLSVPKWVHLSQPLPVGASKSINWVTVWIHACEVRQALQKFHVAGLKRLLAAPIQSYVRILRATYLDLVRNGSRGGCFCVLLIAAVAMHLKIQIHRPVAAKKLNVSHKDLLFFTIQLARRGFSPKVALTGIPERTSLVKGVALFIAHQPSQRIFSRKQVRRIRKLLPNTSILRKRCRAKGIKVQFTLGHRRVSLSRAQMFRKLQIEDIQ